MRGRCLYNRIDGRGLYMLSLEVLLVEDKLALAVQRLAVDGAGARRLAALGLSGARGAKQHISGQG